jgi:ABC-type Fe3+-hydroxamate transport system substrate-binding protein
METGYLSDPLDAFPDLPPRRVVSLVPSTTGSMIDLGLAGTLVGITDYCPHPPSGAALPRLGGPKTPKIDSILALRPELILANREENDRESLEVLRAAGIPIWLSFPKTVKDAIEDLYLLAGLFRADLALGQVQVMETTAEWAELAAQEQTTFRYFCPIWEDKLETGERWWMTFNSATYANDVLRIFHGVNIFAGRYRRYPVEADLGKSPTEEAGGRDTRYPRVSLAEILDAQPELILLPDEPYAYGASSEAEVREIFRDTPAGQAGRVYAFDGSLITWPGTRLARALADLPFFFQT